ncbi:SOS response-associated peptidase [Caldibacillus lycopersici]|uniref:Abasic site processing protein n=1 Tax=Perspicuibacillus lycopersici TaxID=1325689 RepID=A0AAE3IX28_9BACI|nr:SOS response-associated peptidase [Perspicuibacillus lycopersici]MCU9613635.1 SOS response-associated peptidase [Perspicuibacillus lycopersici]
MCGRFTLTAEPSYLIDAFQLQFFPDNYLLNYNIAPSDGILAAVQSVSGRKAGFIRWGLVPSWVKNQKVWTPLINARSETLEKKASFRHLLDKKRCIIFADSFYEWKMVNGKKIPYRIMAKDDKPFAFAGLWDRNNSSPAELVTCTILTTVANGVVQDIHERMPVILNGDEAIEAWINTKKYLFDDIKNIMQPYPQEKQKLYAVSSIVNSIKNNDINCIAPLVSE